MSMLSAVKNRKNREPSGEREEESAAAMGGSESPMNKGLEFEEHGTGGADETASDIPMPPVRGKPVEEHNWMLPKPGAKSMQDTETSRRGAQSDEARATEDAMRHGQLSEDPNSPNFKEHFEYHGSDGSKSYFKHKPTGALMGVESKGE